MNKKFIVTAVGCLILAGTTAYGLMGWDSSNKEIDELKGQLADLQRHGKRSDVLSSISKKMEEIAYVKRKISDE